MDKIIVGTSIIKNFGKGTEENNALDGVNIEIAADEFVAIMGPSGGGKSTLLFALSGMDEINSGSIKFNNVELSGLSENSLADIRRKNMGFVFQQPTMLKNLNILDNIILPSIQGDRKNAAEIIKKARELMHKTGIAELENRDITEVSGGQLQRAGICRAIMGAPDILFADEPTGALNSKSAEEIMCLLSDIHTEGTAILLVTHDAKVAARAQRIFFMKDGKIKHELLLGQYSSMDTKSRTEKIISQMKNFDI